MTKGYNQNWLKCIWSTHFTATDQLYHATNSILRFYGYKKYRDLIGYYYFLFLSKTHFQIDFKPFGYYYYLSVLYHYDGKIIYLLFRFARHFGVSFLVRISFLFFSLFSKDSFRSIKCSKTLRISDDLIAKDLFHRNR